MGRPSRFILFALLLGAVIALFSGCAKDTRYKVLTFFFTGVPSPYEERQKEEKVKEKVEPAKKPIRKVTPRPTAFLHGPYASGQCSNCHESAASVAFRAPAEKGSAGVSATGGGGVSARLVVPLNKLCMECHTHKAVNMSDSGEEWLHGPAGSGYCILCHGAHNGPNRYMLQKSPNEICASCHISQSPGKALQEGLWMHGPAAGGECVFCHGPHKGPSRYMLEKRPEEICADCHASKSVRKAEQAGLWMHGPAAGGGCTLCHGAHSGPNLRMLNKEPNEVCVECHWGGYIANSAVHREPADCLSCHNAHIGRNNLLLKKDYNEIS